MKDIRKKLLVCRPCEQEHKADSSTAQQPMPAVFSVMDNPVSCDQAGELQCELGVYSSHINGASGETVIVSGSKKAPEPSTVVWSGPAVASLC